MNGIPSVMNTGGAKREKKTRVTLYRIGRIVPSVSQMEAANEEVGRESDLKP